MNVGNYKPEKNNAALKYLWARHRILILSDYNKLRSDDKRIKEVTDLGLSYNLLTAYTSFVAVDNEVRNKDGKLTTVKQPLPLPQGVSDYAVGGYGNYPSAMSAQRSYAPMYSKKAKSCPHLAYDMSASGGGGYAAEEKKEKEAAITLYDIIVPKGLTKSDVQKVVQAHLAELGKCLTDKTVQGEITLELTINAEGTVKNINAVSSTLKDANAQQCIVEQMKKWLLPQVTTGKKAKVTVKFKI
jgi:Ca-activated chloride channel family protein